MKPLLILVSGAPGSGKTTLSKLLSQKMGLYHVERDRLKHGIEYMLDTRPEDRIKTVVPVYFAAVEALVKLKISLIADGAQFKGKSESDLQRFANIARVVNIHCHSEDLHERIESRTEERAKINPESEKDYIPDLQRIIAESKDPVDHGYPTLEVNCQNGYEPTIDSIISWINDTVAE